VRELISFIESAKVRPNYASIQPMFVGWPAKLTASMPAVRRTRCFFPSGGRNHDHRPVLIARTQGGWPGWVYLSGLENDRMFDPPQWRPIPVLHGLT